MTTGEKVAPKGLREAGYLTWLFVLLTACCVHVVTAQELTVLRDARQPYLLGPRFELFVDRGHRLTIDDIVSDSIAKQFRQARSPIPNFSSTTSAIWIRFSVVDSTDEYGVWLLEVGYALLDEVTLFTRSQDSSFVRSVSSSSVPVEEREIRHRLHYFHLILEKDIPQEFYLRITARTSIPVALTVRHVREFMDYDHNTQMALGLFYGALLIMMLYNLFLFFSIRDKVYLYYVLYVISYTIYQLGTDGLLKEYVITSGRDFFFWSYAGVGAFLFFGVMFTREYLATKERTKLLDHILQAIGGVALMIFFLTPIMAGGPINLVGTFIGAAYIVAGFAAAIVCRKQGFRPASYYLLALSGFFIGFIFRILRVDALVPMNFFTENAFQMGILWEVTMLSLALGNRINTLKAENARERELIRHRISSDLHDEIGSNLSSITLSSQMVQRSGRLGNLEKRRLAEITATAKETTDAMRDIVWFINPEHDELADLLLRLKEVTSKLLVGYEYTFKTSGQTIETIPDLLMRKEIYLFYKEVLHNIIKHAKASKVDINFMSQKGMFVLSVCDNGIGFEVREVNGGFGLRNLRERAERIGATFDLSSCRGEGTKITLSVPR
jgi:signal transduction histidine kinase